MAFLVQLNLGNPQAVNEFCGAIQPDYRDLCFQQAGANFRSWVTSDQKLVEKCNLFQNEKATIACIHGASLRAR